MTTSRPAITRAIRGLGADINRARRVRRMSTTDFAARMGVSRATLNRLEKGDPGVSIGNVAAALQALGELDRLSGLMDPGSDDAALLITGHSLPKRIRNAPRPAATIRQTRPDAEDPEGRAF